MKNEKNWQWQLAAMARSVRFALTLALVLVFLLTGCAGSDEDKDKKDKDDDDDDDDTMEVDDPISNDEELKADGIDSPPFFHIDPERAAAGETVTVTVEYAAASAINVQAVGTGCGSLASGSGASPLTISGNVGVSGVCRLHAELTLSSGGTQVFEGQVEVIASEPGYPPVEVVGADFTFDPIPTASADVGAPSIQTLAGPVTFINGGSANYDITYSSEKPIYQALIQVQGYEGYFVLPVTGPALTIPFTLKFDSDIFSQPSARPAFKDGGALNILVSLLDALGRLGPEQPLALNGVEVQSGEVKVSLSWDTATDVDLHVDEPGGEQIYYGHKVSGTGGQLDLDSNAGCDIDNVNNENVFWPDGQSPNGTFTVQARMYSDCELGGASGTVTMAFCGEDSPLVESFSLGPAGDSVSWTFENKCTYKVSGKVKYEDFAVTAAGLSNNGVMVPVRFIKVEVRRDDDDELLAEGQTDSRGRYEISFENDGVPGYYVEVVAEQDNERLKQSVNDLSGKLYSWVLEDRFNENEVPDNKDVDFEIKKDEDAAALNIWETGVKCSTYARIYSGQTMPMMPFYWTDGQKPGGKNASFCTRTNKIYILGAAADSDAYDDIIIGHEYGHFVMNVISKSDSPGGGHSSNRQEEPTLSWSEGWATFFGVTAHNETRYMDTNAGGMGVFYSIETPPASKPRGNKDGKLDGNLSEAIAAAVLLDIFDSSNESKDTVTNIGVWPVVTTYLGKDYAKFSDRGYAGRDLVDFLDGWFCLGYGNKGENDESGLRGIVKGLYQLSYDFPELASCE